jgi:thiol:disulfide interchange protein DsbD
VLDVYADWCVACKEMEHLTFTDPAVQAGLDKFQRLQVDVTANSDEDRALLKRFALFGPPGLVFFNTQGSELSQARVVGFLAAEAFIAHLKTLGV